MDTPPLSSPTAVIDALGGPKKAAEKLGSTPQAVVNWYERGIPPEHFLVVTEQLTALGKSAQPTVFNMKQTNAGAAA